MPPAKPTERREGDEAHVHTDRANARPIRSGAHSRGPSDGSAAQRGVWGTHIFRAPSSSRVIWICGLIVSAQTGTASTINSATLFSAPSGTSTGHRSTRPGMALFVPGFGTLQGSPNTRWISTLAARFGVVFGSGVLLYG